MNMNERADDPEAARALAVAGEIRVLIGQLRQRLREQSHLGDFSLTQLQVLVWLESEGPATVTSIARAQGMRPQSMGETLAVLKSAGLVSGVPDPNDGRQTILSLTADCRKKIKAARAAKDDWLFQAIRSKLTQAEQKQLATGVELLKRLIDS